MTRAAQGEAQPEPMLGDVATVPAGGESTRRVHAPRPGDFMEDLGTLLPCGDYLPGQLIGRGGMGEVRHAVRIVPEGSPIQRVCIKKIRADFVDDAALKDAFLAEGRIAASLQHSNIVSVIEVDVHGRWIVLELVKGVNLRELLQSTPGHCLPTEIAVLITIELCKALNVMHGQPRHGDSKGIVHRDISAANVLISYAGEVKLADFGVAKVLRADSEPQTKLIRGKADYMAPERAAQRDIDGRSDLFSLAILLYEMLAGRRPVTSPSESEIFEKLAGGPGIGYPALIDVAPHVPSGLADIVHCSLQPAPEKRYDCVRDFLRALAEVVKHDVHIAPDLFLELGQRARAAARNPTLDPNVLLQQYRRDSLLAAEALPNDDAGGAIMPAAEPAQVSAPEHTESLVPTRAASGLLTQARAARRTAPTAAVMLLCGGVAATWSLRADSPRTVTTTKSRVAIPSAPFATSNNNVVAAKAALVTSTSGLSLNINDKPDSEREGTTAIDTSEPARDMGLVRVGAFPMSRVRIDGIDFGLSPVVAKVAAGKPHDVTVGTKQKTVTVGAGAERTVFFRLNP